jgi:hypothetical protein
MWGPYPALLDGPPGNVVKGMGYEVEGGEDKDKLAAYETTIYREQKCLIQFREDTVIGTTFMWAGDMDELKEGSFDLKDWQMARVLEDWFYYKYTSPAIVTPCIIPVLVCGYRRKHIRVRVRAHGGAHRGVHESYTEVRPDCVVI